MKDLFKSLFDKAIQPIVDKSSQYIISIGGGLVVAIETSIPFFIPCFIVTILDVWSAYCLGKRVHKKYPERSDGKFKSEYKFRIMYTMLIALLLVIVASYVDTHVIKDTDVTVRFVLGMFLFYQAWSILENWSSENTNKVAKSLQKIMINKAERHFNIDLSDLKDEKTDGES